MRVIVLFLVLCSCSESTKRIQESVELLKYNDSTDIRRLQLIRDAGLSDSAAIRESK